MQPGNQHQTEVRGRGEVGGGGGWAVKYILRVTRHIYRLAEEKRNMDHAQRHQAAEQTNRQGQRSRPADLFGRQWCHSNRQIRRNDEIWQQWGCWVHLRRRLGCLSCRFLDRWLAVGVWRRSYLLRVAFVFWYWSGVAVARGGDVLLGGGGGKISFK